MSQTSSYPYDHPHEDSSNHPLSGIGSLVEEVGRWRSELVRRPKKTADNPRTRRKKGTTRELGKIVTNANLEPTSTVVELEPFRMAREAEAGPGIKGGQEALDPKCIALGEILTEVINSPELKSLLENPLPTMLWTPPTHHLIPDRMANFGARFRKVADHSPDSDCGQTMERRCDRKLEDISGPVQTQFMSKLAGAFQLYRGHDPLAGDAAIRQALSELTHPSLVSDSGLSIPLLTMAVVSRTLSEFNKHPEETCPSSHSAQMAEMNRLADKVAGNSARLLARAGGDLVKSEAISGLVIGLAKAVKEAITSLDSRIEHNAIEALARGAARDGCTEPLVRLIKRHVAEEIECQSRQALQQTLEAMAQSTVRYSQAQTNALPRKFKERL